MNTKIFLLTFFITLLFTVILTKKLIPILVSKKVGQSILEIGPSWHKSKEGTPTMGGIGFVISSFIALFVAIILFANEIADKELHVIINIFVYGLLNCIVGLIDDIAKLRKNKNEGLTPAGKLIFQSLAAVVFLVLMSITTDISTTMSLPFFNLELDLGIFYYVLCFLLLCGVTNAVNLTDGIDGLASTCVLTVGTFFAFVSFVLYDSVSLSFFGAILMGASLGFLFFNLHPAKIFMGDTGSLFFGALVVGVSFAINTPLLVLLYGFVFILEAISVILQVVYFKATKGKRLFKMAPLHHHFEKSGFSEMKVVSIFGIVNALFCIIAFLGII